MLVDRTHDAVTDARARVQRDAPEPPRARAGSAAGAASRESLERAVERSAHSKLLTANESIVVPAHQDTRRLDDQVR